jgi:hypothetical protein
MELAKCDPQRYNYETLKREEEHFSKEIKEMEKKLKTVQSPLQPIQ